MRSNLDKIKSSITISLGTKNRLRKLKGSKSYEDFINQLLRLRNQGVHTGENLIELQKFERKKGIYSFDDFKILFSYNKYNNSENFIFDISIEKVREKGKEVNLSKYLQRKTKDSGKTTIEMEYDTYFKLLIISIQKGIDSMFTHKGRFEDYYSWKQEFESLGLSNKTFEEDIMDKLNGFEQGRDAFE